MKQPVEERRRERCIVSEGLVPLAERQIAGQDQTASFVPFSDYLEGHCQLVGSGTDYGEESIAQEAVDGF